MHLSLLYSQTAWDRNYHKETPPVNLSMHHEKKCLWRCRDVDMYTSRPGYKWFFMTINFDHFAVSEYLISFNVNSPRNLGSGMGDDVRHCKLILPLLSYTLLFIYIILLLFLHDLFAIPPSPHIDVGFMDFVRSSMALLILY